VNGEIGNHRASKVLARRQPQHNKALHPTASVPLVPRFTSAAGELGRSAAARNPLAAQQNKWKRWTQKRL
jgi:hypothetical protein